MKTDSTTLLTQQQKILNNTTPLLPKRALTAFVDTYFNRRDVYLGALDRHPSPLYLQERSVLKACAQKFKHAFQRRLPSVACYFAVKSNNHPNVAEVLIEEGFGLDVSSGLELEMALALGAKDVIFSGPGKTEKELLLAVNHSDRVTILIDSIGELGRLAAIAAGENRSIRCGVRLTINPTGLWRKFGITLQALPAFWEAANQYSHIRLSGLQFHLSWNMSPEAQVAFIQTLGDIIRNMPQEFKSRIEFIDIGGGYWPEQGEWLQPAGTPEGNLRKALGADPGDPEHHHRLPADGIEWFAGKVGEALENHIFSILPAPCRICLEPGRWICNDAVHLIISVVDKKAPDLVITDAGTNAVGWERFETDYFPILNLTRPSLTERKCDILGSLCTPHDVWGYMYFGEAIKPGDILMIPTQGAYTYSLRQEFIKPLPAVCMI
jgi:diaminopimelate decarboxylase